jgi:hypothetical protein
MTSKRELPEIMGVAEPETLEARIHQDFLALEDADEMFAQRLVKLAKDVGQLKRKHPGNVEFGRVWDAQNYRYHGRALNKNERYTLVDIDRYASAHPDKVVRDIAASHSKSIERIGRKLALPPPPQPLRPGWRFDAESERYCFNLAGPRSEISIVVTCDGDGSREWHWGFGWIDGDEDIGQGEADDRQTAMRDAEVAARRVMDEDDGAFESASSEPSEDEADTAPQSQSTPQERAAGLGATSAPIDAEGSETTDETEPEDTLPPGWTKYDGHPDDGPEYHFDLDGGFFITVLRDHIDEGGDAWWEWSLLDADWNAVIEAEDLFADLAECIADAESAARKRIADAKPNEPDETPGPVASSDEDQKTDDTKTTVYCSFCGKSSRDVRRMIAGTSAAICDECLDECVALNNKESGAKIPEKAPDPARDDLGSLSALLDFDASRRQRLLDLNPRDAEVLLQVATKVRASLDALITEARERLGKPDPSYDWAEAFAESFAVAPVPHSEHLH